MFFRLARTECVYSYAYAVHVNNVWVLGATILNLIHLTRYKRLHLYSSTNTRCITLHLPLLPQVLGEGSTHIRLLPRHLRGAHRAVWELDPDTDATRVPAGGVPRHGRARHRTLPPLPRTYVPLHETSVEKPFRKAAPHHVFAGQRVP